MHIEPPRCTCTYLGTDIEGPLCVAIPEVKLRDQQWGKYSPCVVPAFGGRGGTPPMKRSQPLVFLTFQFLVTIERIFQLFSDLLGYKSSFYTFYSDFPMEDIKQILAAPPVLCPIMDWYCDNIGPAGRCQRCTVPPSPVSPSMCYKQC